MSAVPPGAPADVAADRALVHGCVEGERRAQETFVRSYAALVYASIHRAARGRSAQMSEEEIEDLHGRIFLAFFEDNCRRLQAFEGRCRLSSWVRVLSVNLTIDYLRRRLRTRRTFAPQLEDSEGNAIDPEGPQVDPENHARARREVQGLLEIVSKLPAADQRLLSLLFESEASYDEIAAEFGISVGAVYTRKTRLLDRLKAALPGELWLRD